MSVEEKPGNAFDVAEKLGRYIAGMTGRKQEDAELRAFMNALVDARCETPADALAVTAMAEGLMTDALRKTQAGSLEASELAMSIAVAVLLCRNAIGALEDASGLAVEGFGGERGTIN